MTKASKISLATMSLGFLVWIVPALYYRYPTKLPLSIPLPLAQGNTLQQQFTVRGSQKYDVFVRCTEVGEFKEKWKDFLNWKEHPKVPCEIDLRILRDGRQAYSAHLKSLEPAMLSGEHVFWGLAYVPLSSGIYELQLTNGIDLTYLSATQPTLEVKLNSLFIKNWSLNASLGLVAGGLVFVIGIVIFIAGVFIGKRPANFSVERMAADGTGLQIRALVARHHRSPLR
jgi:hypothetical protein